MSWLARLRNLFRRGNGEGREAGEQHKKAEFLLQLKPWYTRKNSKSWAGDGELPGEGYLYDDLWVMQHRIWGAREEIGLHCLACLQEVKDSRLVTCLF